MVEKEKKCRITHDLLHYVLDRLMLHYHFQSLALTSSFSNHQKRKYRKLLLAMIIVAKEKLIIIVYTHIARNINNSEKNMSMTPHRSKTKEIRFRKINRYCQELFILICKIN